MDRKAANVECVQQETIRDNSHTHYFSTQRHKSASASINNNSEMSTFAKTDKITNYALDRSGKAFIYCTVGPLLNVIDASSK
jgi:hypothetical protein